MEFISQLERTVLGWVKSVPHIPSTARKWLGDNVWWIIAIAAAISGIAALGFLVGLFGQFAALTTVALSYYASTSIVMWVIVQTSVSLVFTALLCVLFASAIMPLKAKQKKGWVLVFAALLLSIISIVVDAVLTFNTFGFITAIIFGGLVVAIWAYFLFEIHGEFAHVEHSKGVKAKK